MLKIPELKATRKAKVMLGSVSVLILALILVNTALRVALWINYHEFVFADKVVEFDFRINKPLTIVERKPQVREVYVGQAELDKLVQDSENPTVAEYIVKKFGPVEGIKALAIARAESGLREEAVNLNGGKSLDTGIFQINSVHWDKEGCSLKELTDAYKNVDCAYSIYEAQGGFQAWVAYTNGTWLAQLGK